MLRTLSRVASTPRTVALPEFSATAFGSTRFQDWSARPLIGLLRRFPGLTAAIYLVVRLRFQGL